MHKQFMLNLLHAPLAMLNWVARLLRRQQNGTASEMGTCSAAPIHDGPATELQAAFDRGKELFSNAQYGRAAEYFQAAIDTRHDWAEAHRYLGLALYQLDLYEDAADAFAMAICFSPKMGKAHFALALAERKLGRLEAALVSVERALAYGERNAEAFNVRGALLFDRGDVGGALASFESAVEADPAHAPAHSNLGYILFRDFGQYDRGEEHIERALELDPENIDIRCNYTMVVSLRGEHERALALCNELLSIRPEMHEVRLNRAHVSLKLGRFETGWDDYEARKLVRCNFVARELPCPEWRGEGLGGKTILIRGEQGLGDEIMFASCFGEFMAGAGQCVIECAPRLERLFRRSFPGAIVFAGQQSAEVPAWWERAPAIDFQIPAGSVPRYLRRSCAAFPDHRGYLVPDPRRVVYWRDRLAALGSGPKVGISWRGGMPSTRRNLRSIELAAWAPLLRTSEAHFISLQYGDTVDERARVVREQGFALNFWQEAIEDLDETAALVAALDVVISVCTAVIHLAGAIGRPVWILVPTSPEWRYQVFGETMPWYPSARLIRQRSPGDWQPAIDVAERRLRELVAASDRLRGR